MMAISVFTKDVELCNKFGRVLCLITVYCPLSEKTEGQQKSNRVCGGCCTSCHQSTLLSPFIRCKALIMASLIEGTIEAGPGQIFFTKWGYTPAYAS
jgi:hypothetical protein